MLPSRGLSLLKSARNLRSPIVQQARNSGEYSYRCGAYPHTGLSKYGPAVFGGIMWWWILWHLITDPEHITGEWLIPDISKLTDEELGIPPDDVD